MLLVCLFVIINVVIVNISIYCGIKIYTLAVIMFRVSSSGELLYGIYLKCNGMKVLIDQSCCMLLECQKTAVM